MPVKPRSRRQVAADAVTSPTPLLPTVVVGTYKGGCWKTSIAVALSERLAMGGATVLLVTTDMQQDAWRRLGLIEEAGEAAAVEYGDGFVAVVTAQGSKTVDLLYRVGTGSLRMGAFDVVIVDTAPVVEAGRFPGVFLIAPTDGVDATHNLVKMLMSVPSSSSVALVKTSRCKMSAWQQEATAISEASEFPCEYLTDPVPPADAIREAHNVGESVWTLPRRGDTKKFLDMVETLAHATWAHMGRSSELPTAPPSGASAIFIEGWDD